ncbi:LytR C-terminal domain-containing protein [bacterium]
MKIIRILTICLLFTVLGVLIHISHTSNAAEYVRNNKAINILFIGSNNSSLESLLLVRYDPSHKIIYLFPVSTNAKIYNEEKKLYYRLSKLFPKYFRQNKGDIYKTCAVLTQDLKTYISDSILFYVNITHQSFQNIISLLNDIKPEDLETPQYNKIFHNKDTETAYKDQFTNILALSKLFGNAKTALLLVPVITNTSAYITTNIQIIDVITLIAQPKQKKDYKIVLTGVPKGNDAKHGAEYILNTIKILEQNIEHRQTIKAEVLNASTKRGLAHTITRILRSNNIDVKTWGNNLTIEPKTMVIDRTGNWNNAKRIADIIGSNTLFSRINKDCYVDVSVILGEDNRE